MRIEDEIATINPKKYREMMSNGQEEMTKLIDQMDEKFEIVSTAVIKARREAEKENPKLTIDQTAQVMHMAAMELEEVIMQEIVEELHYLFLGDVDETSI
jgi:hypothetical protein